MTTIKNRNVISPIKKSSFKPKQQIGLGCANFGALEKKYVLEALENKRLSYGPFSSRLEALFSKIHECRYGVFCNSGTSALQIALACLKETEGWKDGDEVLVPAITFVATSNMILENRLTPVFVDVHPKTYNINPLKIEEKITPKTKAIIPVHMFGLPCDMDPILALAKKYKLKIIEDSCETMFVKYKGKSVGTFGDISCFSTYMAHLLVTGVGGFALTNNPDYAVILKSLMNHGRDSIYLSIDDDKTKDQERLFKIVEGRFRFVRVGYSFRATELEAALGVAQLEKKEFMTEKRWAHAQFLKKKLSGLSSFVQLPSVPTGFEHAFMMFPIVIRSDAVKKEDLVFHLERNKIETRDMLPLTNQPVYQKIFGPIEDQFPIAKWINSNGFYIGCHQGLSQNELQYIVDTFFDYFREKQLIS